MRPRTQGQRGHPAGERWRLETRLKVTSATLRQQIGDGSKDMLPSIACQAAHIADVIKLHRLQGVDNHRGKSALPRCVDQHLARQERGDRLVHRGMLELPDETFTILSDSGTSRMRSVAWLT